MAGELLAGGLAVVEGVEHFDQIVTRSQAAYKKLAALQKQAAGAVAMTVEWVDDVVTTSLASSKRGAGNTRHTFKSSKRRRRASTGGGGAGSGLALVQPTLTPVHVDAQPMQVEGAQQQPQQHHTMPRYRRRVRFARKRRRRKSYCARKRKRVRRKSVVRRKRRRRSSGRVLLSTRMLNPSVRMRFNFTQQIFVTSKPGGWGVLKLVLNTMERPLGELIPAGSTFNIKADAHGNIARQPSGYDRWIDGAGSVTPGKYERYTVESCSFSLTHIPAILETSGENMIVSINTMVGEENDGDIYRDQPVDEVAPLMTADGAKLWGRARAFNIGHLGQVFKGSWNYRQWIRKNPGRKAEDPLDRVLIHNGTNVGDGTFFKAFARITFGQLGAAAEDAKAMNFLLRMSYVVTLTRPTSFAQAVDEAGGLYPPA